MLVYRGRLLDINERFVEDFEKYNGYSVDEDIIDGYIYSKYIKDKSREDEVPLIADSLSDEEIEAVVEEYLKYILSLYTVNPHYGEE